MATLDELEAALRTSWDRDLLAVYADHLQSLGELRGELIAIDLRIESDGPTPELVARRKELLAAWLVTLPPGKVQHGFVDVDATGPDPVEQVRTALASPAAPYIRTVAIVGPPNPVREALEILASQPRRGIVRLVVRQWDHGSNSTLGRRATANLFAALPDLDTLELDGYAVCGAAAHQTLRRLRISGATASAALDDTPSGDSWVALEELDFAFASHIGGQKELEVATLAAVRFPGLRLLDLSRNEPGFLDPITLGAKVGVIDWIAPNPLLRRLRVLRLPRIRGASLRAATQMLETLPELEEVAVRGGLSKFSHAKARLTVI